MAIIYQTDKRIFTLTTQHTSYQFIVDAYGYLLHLYYGTKIEGELDYILTHFNRGFSGNPYDAQEDRTYSLDALPQEFAVTGNGDYRRTALLTEAADGSTDMDPRFVSYEITDGKYSIPGLPAAYASSDAQTLTVSLEDPRVGLAVDLLYGVLEDCDVITRSVRIRNIGSGDLILRRVYSTCLDFIYGNYDCISFYGRHAMERNVQRRQIGHGTFEIGSHRGTSSHQYNPSLFITDHEATETAGDVYGLAFVYSGGFDALAELDGYGEMRVMMGITQERFAYPLHPGDVFHAPEVAMSFAADGIGAVSRNFHRLVQEHITRGYWRDKVRPSLVNSWEAAYFDFTGDTICALADKAAELGIELVVMDDGWFGKRNADDSSLGDWITNEKKLGGTLRELTDKVHQKGIKFGIWIEPEMVNEDSDLYRAHPEWAMTVPGKKPVLSRSQLVLDLSNPEVVTYLHDSIAAMLHSAEIDYVKWDMNRSLHDIFSRAGDCQGKVQYDYMIGLYRLLEKLTGEFPEILWEGCSGGGGRFDLGMMYYTPQIWCSDNTDAIDRTRIQYGTSFVYPLSTMGSHVSAVPNHQTGRVTPIETRGVTSLTGAFGYELDLNKLSVEEQEAVRKQVADYKKVAPLLMKGDYARLSNPFKDAYSAWQVTAKDRSEALVSLVMLEAHGNDPVSYVKLKDLDPDAMYRDEKTGKTYSGGALTKLGLPAIHEMGEYMAFQWHFYKV